MIVEAIGVLVLLALIVAGHFASRLPRRPPTELESLRELYARDEISMLELERGIEKRSSAATRRTKAGRMARRDSRPGFGLTSS